MKTPNIILIENETGMQTFFQTRLKALGFKCHVAKTGNEGLGLLKSLDCQLVIVDMNLPDIRGLTVINTMKSNGHAGTPILAYSFDDKHQSIMEKFDIPFLLRPILNSQLINHLSTILQ